MIDVFFFFFFFSLGMCNKNGQYCVLGWCREAGKKIGERIRNSLPVLNLMGQTWSQLWTLIQILIEVGCTSFVLSRVYICKIWKYWKHGVWLGWQINFRQYGNWLCYMLQTCYKIHVSTTTCEHNATNQIAASWTLLPYYIVDVEIQGSR